jgi:hypothetical protein
MDGNPLLLRLEGHWPGFGHGIGLLSGPKHWPGFGHGIGLSSGPRHLPGGGQGSCGIPSVPGHGTRMLLMVLFSAIVWFVIVAKDICELEMMYDRDAITNNVSTSFENTISPTS